MSHISLLTQRLMGIYLLVVELRMMREDAHLMRINDSSSEEEDVPLPQPGDMHVKFKKSSLPKRAKLSNNRSIPSRFRQKSKGDLCDKILKLESEVDDLKEEIALLNYNMKKLKAQFTSSATPSSPPLKKET